MAIVQVFAGLDYQVDFEQVCVMNWPAPVFLAKHVFSPKNGSVSRRPVNGYINVD